MGMITSNTVWAADTDREWYVLGECSLILPAAVEEHENLAFRLGAGMQVTEHIGFELLWDTAPGLQPRSLIQQANLPQTIGPLTYDIQSHRFQYLTAFAVMKLPLRNKFTIFGKIGLAQHHRSIEFDVLTSGSTFMEGVKVDDSAITPVISFGQELAVKRINRLSIGYSATAYIGKDSEATLFSVFAKLKI